MIIIGTKIYGNGKSSSLENNNGFGNFSSSTVLKIKLEHNLARPVVTPFHLTWMKYRFLPDLFNSLVPLATHCFHIFFFSTSGCTNDTSCKGIGEFCDMSTNICECSDGKVKDSNGDCRNSILGMYTANIFIYA